MIKISFRSLLFKYETRSGNIYKIHQRLLQLHVLNPYLMATSVRSYTMSSLFIPFNFFHLQRMVFQQNEPVMKYPKSIKTLALLMETNVTKIRAITLTATHQLEYKTQGWLYVSVKNRIIIHRGVSTNIFSWAAENINLGQQERYIISFCFLM